MARGVLLSICLAFLFGCAAGQNGITDGVILEPGDIWIRGVTLISAERAAPVQHANVVIRNERILSADVTVPRIGATGVNVVDGESKYLVPGLIDGHVHLAQVPGMQPEHEKAMPAITAAYYRQLPRSYLYFGFTGIVDLNVIDSDRLNRLRAEPLGPTILDCGNALSIANGYPMAFAPAETRFESYPNFLYDSRQSNAIPSKYRAADHSPDVVVQRVASAGGVCIKAHFERGFGPLTGLPVPTVELMRQVRDASDRRRLPLLLHANSLEAHRFAVEVGVDAVVHGLWNFGVDLARGAELPGTVRDVLDAEIRNGIAYMPTSRVLSGLADLFNPAFLDDAKLAKVIPAELIEWYRTKDGQWFRDELAKDAPGSSNEQMFDMFGSVSDRDRSASYIAMHGGRIAFGSDTPSAPIFSNPPGLNGYLELRELEMVGLSPQQLLKAATLENARLFRIEKEYGTIEPGKIANVLVLRENPLNSTTAFDTIESVIIKGRIVSRESLAQQGK
jgi:imidazolonepropionase-like amidohydrolase